MLRRAQTIRPKTPVFIARLGCGPGDVVLEAGIGSAGLSMHIARTLGALGTHITVEPRQEHADVGLENLRRAEACWAEFPTHHHIEGTVESSTEAITELVGTVDAVVLDLPDHPPAILATAALIKPGGRLACYCPVSSQLEHAWDAAERAGLTVEWAGELMEREWVVHRRGEACVRSTDRLATPPFCSWLKNGDHSITRILLSHFGQVNRKGATLPRGTPRRASQVGQLTLF